MNNNLVNEITASQLRNDLPEFSSGDEVKVSVRIVEGNKTRIQNFQGVVISRRGGGVSATFTVRKVSGGIGAEAFPPYQSMGFNRDCGGRHGVSFRPLPNKVRSYRSKVIDAGYDSRICTDRALFPLTPGLDARLPLMTARALPPVDLIGSITDIFSSQREILHRPFRNQLWVSFR